MESGLTYSNRHWTNTFGHLTDGLLEHDVLVLRIHGVEVVLKNNPNIFLKLSHLFFGIMLLVPAFLHGERWRQFFVEPRNLPGKCRGCIIGSLNQARKFY